MYSLGENWIKIYKICSEGLVKDKDDELLNNVMDVLNEYDDKYGIKYRIFTGTITARNVDLEKISIEN